MRVVLFADSHGSHRKLKISNGDLLIFAGDFSGMSTLMDITDFNQWLGTLSHKNKLVIYGNHETQCEKDLSLSLVMLNNAEVLFDSGVNINGIRIHGSPFTPSFNDWAFMADEETLDKYFSLIPENLDLLVTHGPPYGILDETLDGHHIGSTALLKHTQRVKPKFHVFGHNHNGFGIYDNSITKFINCSVMNEIYQAINESIVIYI